MSNTFVNKVAAERKALSIVNSKTSGRYQLTGLSSAAVDLWRRQVGSERTAAVAIPLAQVADLCRLLSDRSHETFHEIDPSMLDKIEIHMLNLEKEVAKLN